MAAFRDQLGRQINVNYPPLRIISLVPSQTELLFYLGLDHEIVGVTKFCTYPADKIAAKAVVGGTKQLNIDEIRDLKPDLVIANKEENERSQIEALSAEFPVWISDISDLAGALKMIAGVGEVIGKQTAASRLIIKIKYLFDNYKVVPLNLSVAYFIWRKPYMVAGKSTFINDLLERCGLINAFTATRYPEVSTDLLVQANPEVVLLSSEPYPFKEKHIQELKSILPDAIIMLVDGELFSWYGNRLLFAPAYFKKLTACIIKAKTQNEF